MKKIFLLTSLIALALAGCNSNTQDNNKSSDSSSIGDPQFVFERSSLSIVTPTGAPALGFYDFATSPNFETNDYTNEYNENQNKQVKLDANNINNNAQSTKKKKRCC